MSTRKSKWIEGSQGEVKKAKTVSRDKAKASTCPKCGKYRQWVTRVGANGSKGKLAKICCEEVVDAH